ncbi:MAG: hypothetical protein EAZ89_13105 [Bacteroidetes bacterium]|nr:MAG: hypothetical protein EAZ89_13105 [Bacteroidota bacterium]
METLTFQPASPRTVNVSDDAVIILRTVDLLDQKFGMNYLVQVLRGQDRYELRSEAHAGLPTYGAMAQQTYERVSNLVTSLLDLGLLAVREQRTGALTITEAGRDFLKHPTALEISSRQLRTARFDKVLMVELRQLRLQLSRELSVPPYRIFNDHSLLHLVRVKPATLAELIELPGFGSYSANRFGPAILKTIAGVQEQQAVFQENFLYKRTLQPAYQDVKHLFESGMDVEGIAARRNVKTDSIRVMLSDLHRAGRINLHPWIERNLAPEILRKGTEFFRNNQTGRLREAYESLGLDWNTLRLCKLYVSDFASRQDELKMAS